MELSDNVGVAIALFLSGMPVGMMLVDAFAVVLKKSTADSVCQQLFGNDAQWVSGEKTQS